MSKWLHSEFLSSSHYMIVTLIFHSLTVLGDGQQKTQIRGEITIRLALANQCRRLKDIKQEKYLDLLHFLIHSLIHVLFSFWHTHKQLGLLVSCGHPFLEVDGISSCPMSLLMCVFVTKHNSETLIRGSSWRKILYADQSCSATSIQDSCLQDRKWCDLTFFKVLQCVNGIKSQIFLLGVCEQS